MPCKHCTDPDGEPCYPQFGLAPHLHRMNDNGEIETIFLLSKFYPSNYHPLNETEGVWSCPKCGEGNPDAESEGE